jgi:flagellar protein FliJ
MFIFKLQSVLEYRKNIEEKILNDFSEKKRELKEERLKLKNLVEERANLIEALRNMQGLKVLAEDIAALVSYVEQVREEEKKQKKVITQVKEQVEAKRKELLEAVKKRKVMEKLKERHLEEYEFDMRALEQKDSDEMGAIRYGRREK